MQENIIIFDESSKKSLLRIMNKSVDSQGFIVEKENPSERVLTKDGEEIKLEEFAGVRKGSEVFIKNDMNSILELAESF
ncbi:MAG TPA: hypothetical protein VJB35_02060 [Candidatus Nanoarchaeia archaeon]|nr:hypothetical protein [uncultured archaeon]AQS29584.1 hypothetical protein [uncultured archaeon]HLD55023.1 hypothetical protein [Candidatus Nanoarchaeia archaeon]